MKNQKGFSLIELLVVVIIIGIIAAIAIPSLLSSRRAAQEASAVSALRTISSAEATYQASNGGGSAYGTLAELAAAAANSLIDSQLGGGRKGNYTFTLTGAPTAYCVTAIPDDVTTYRTYAISADGVIKTDVGNTPAGANAGCSATFISTGDVLGSVAVAPAPGP